MKRQFRVFLIRVVLNTFGLWLAIALFGTGFDESDLTAGFFGFLFAGFIFSVVNSVIRPVVVILSLPAILVTLGLFTLVVNGFMVWIALNLAPGFDITFFNAIITGIVLSLLNYVVSSVFELGYDSPTKKET